MNANVHVIDGDIISPFEMYSPSNLCTRRNRLKISHSGHSHSRFEEKKYFNFIVLCVCVCVFLSPFLFRLFAVKTTQSDSLEHRAHSTSFETCQWMSFAIINISSRTFGHTDTRSDRTPEHSWKSGSNMNFETKIKCTASINTWTIKSLRWCVYLHGQCTSPRYQWRQPRTCRVEESIQSSSKWANHKNLAPCEHI